VFWNCIFYISLMYEFLHSQDQKQTFAAQKAMSALPLKADIGAAFENVR